VCALSLRLAPRPPVCYSPMGMPRAAEARARGKHMHEAPRVPPRVSAVCCCPCLSRLLTSRAIKKAPLGLLSLLLELPSIIDVVGVKGGLETRDICVEHLQVAVLRLLLDLCHVGARGAAPSLKYASCALDVLPPAAPAAPSLNFSMNSEIPATMALLLLGVPLPLPPVLTRGLRPLAPGRPSNRA